MKIFECTDYREIIQIFLKNIEEHKSFSLSEIAEQCKISPSTLTLVLKNNRELTLEQGFAIADFFNLTELEKEYFLTLISLSRAGTEPLKEYFQEKIRWVQTEAYRIKNMSQNVVEISKDFSKDFFSHWSYSAILLFMSINTKVKSEYLAQTLKIPKIRIENQIKELIAAGLVNETINGYIATAYHLHIDRDSLPIVNHHKNWRQKSIEHIDQMHKDNLYLTCPITCSQEESEKIMKELKTLFNKIIKRAITTKPEEARCLNIDFFKV